jgi:L-ascorbate metabolism protein UlaG (beta-lactamase superfamily)
MQPKFGKTPSDERVQRFEKSPHYRDGSFKNLRHTPDLAEGVTYYEVIKEFFFERKSRLTPIDHIPSVKTDLLSLKKEEDVLIWFGHSSYFIQLDGKRILVDPVLSGSASPLPFGTNSFKGTDIYTTDDFPDIDYLFISHDHWDHLDYETILKLRSKVKTVICGLGTGEHLEYWGYNKNSIIEKDWHEEVALDSGFVVNIVPARHFSGRGLQRNKALWVSFVLQTPTMKLFIGGDSGYDAHFAEIGKKFDGFDLAILENGQYDRKWKYIHLMPDEILNAAQELKAKRIFPVHSSKFVLGNHSWDEPLELITKNNESRKLNVITPMIGEQVFLKDTTQQFTHWWRNVR